MERSKLVEEISNLNKQKWKHLKWDEHKRLINAKIGSKKKHTIYESKGNVPRGNTQESLEGEIIYLCQRSLDQAGCKSKNVHEWQGPEGESQHANPYDRPLQYFSENLLHTGIEHALSEDFFPLMIPHLLYNTGFFDGKNIPEKEALKPLVVKLVPKLPQQKNDMLLNISNQNSESYLIQIESMKKK
ncbi:Uncharacterized protein Fot_13959 [Forsythia ovata]|uniref:Uncharacterized protein n=1 Tax=Forsythia ovata TaxID=205694 RepID=A0ABD1W4Y6_9LAMI